MKQCWAIGLIAFIAEVLTIIWQWGHSPTHGVRDWYEGSFRAYFVDSISPWIAAFVSLGLLWVLIRGIKLRLRKSRNTDGI